MLKDSFVYELNPFHSSQAPKGYRKMSISNFLAVRMKTYKTNIKLFLSHHFYRSYNTKHTKMELKIEHLATTKYYLMNYTQNK